MRHLLRSPVLFSYAELFRALVCFGYAVKEEPYAAFYTRLKLAASDSGASLDARRAHSRRQKLQCALRSMEWRRVCTGAEENALSPLLGHLSPAWAAAPPNPKYDQSNVTAVLADTPIRCPKISEVLPSQRCAIEAANVHSCFETHTFTPTISQNRSRPSSAPCVYSVQKGPYAHGSQVMGVYLTYLISCRFLPPPPDGANPDVKIQWETVAAFHPSLSVFCLPSRLAHVRHVWFVAVSAPAGRNDSGPLSAARSARVWHC